VLPPSFSAVASQVLTTPVLVCLGTRALPGEVLIDGVDLVQALKDNV
jgi:hypothetical protein